MSSNINVKYSTIASSVIKRTGSLIGNSAISYAENVMPSISSLTKDIASTTKEISSTINNSNNSNNIITRVRKMKTQANFRNIFKWYMDEELELGISDAGDNTDSLSFDVDTSDAEIREIEISEASKNARDIQRSVISSSKHLAEAQLSASANIISGLEANRAVIKAGFERVDSTLNKILEVVTQNTSALIKTKEVELSSKHSKEDPVGNILTGKFNISDYKKIIKSNISKSEVGAFLPLISLMNPGMISQVLTPENIMGALFQNAINKKAPNLSKNLKALDSAIEETIVDSLIRIGTNNSRGLAGSIGRMFGIDASSKRASTSRSDLAVKTVPFDGIAHEAITNTIPGYLRKILIQLGGKDEVYDYRSRRFRTNSYIERDFNKNLSTIGNMSSKNVKNVLGTDRFGQMLYDLMLSDIGSNKMNERGRQFMKSFDDPNNFKQYAISELFKGINLSSAELKRIDQISRNISIDNKNYGSAMRDINLSAAKNNIIRNKRISEYIEKANEYNIDISNLEDSFDNERKSILRKYNKISDISPGTKSSVSLSGTDYTNKALYSIFKRLDKGINVYQVGSDNLRKKPYSSYKKYLSKPSNIKMKDIVDTDNDESVTMSSNFSTISGENIYDTEENLLRNAEGEDLSRMDRLKRWSSKRGRQFRSALFSGNPEDIKALVGSIYSDISDVTKDQVKKVLATVNNQYGNVTGFLQHKLFGTSYSYTDGVDENGNPVVRTVAKNEKGGVFGFVTDYFKDMFTKPVTMTKKWFEDVKGYFDYGDSETKEDSGIKTKRRKLISTSVGALAGAGILGGPIGLIMGSIAGNALSGIDISGKIKSFLFGRDEKGKAKGLFTKLGDTVVDPIKYQVGKTVNHVGNVLKKDVFGPLSDLGIAIKDRITSSAETHFGKVFKFAANLLYKPFKMGVNGLLNIAKTPISLLGLGTRVGTSATGSMVGGLINSATSIIAGKSKHITIDPETGEEIVQSTKSFLRGRRKDRKNSISENRFSDYKTWKASENERRANMFSKFGEYTKEELVDISESTGQTAKLSKDMRDDIRLLTDEATTKGSLYTHDQGLHDRLDTIINSIYSITKSSPGFGAVAPNNDPIISSGLLASTILAASNDEVSQTEFSLSSSILDESQKSKPNKKRISTKLRELMKLNGGNKNKSSEKKESIFDKLKDILGKGLGFITDNLGAVIAAIGGLALLTSSNGESIKNGITNGIKLLTGLGSSENPVTDGANAVFGMTGNKVKNVFDFANPFAKLFHNKKDATGNEIVNKNATRAKRSFQLAGIRQGLVSNDGLFSGIKSIGKNVAKVGVGVGLSTAAGKGVESIFLKAGASREDAIKSGKYARGITASGLMINHGVSKMMKKSSIVDDVLKLIKMGMDFLIKHFSAVKQLKSFASKITSNLDDLFIFIKQKMTEKIATEIAQAIALRTGKEVTKELVSAIAAGIPIAIAAVYGLISGAINVHRLFMVKPGQADGIMTMIASIMKGAFSALEWAPGIGIFIAAIDLIDELIVKTIRGKTFEQSIAEGIYNAIKDDAGAELRRLQEEAIDQLWRYNRTTGSDLDMDAFMDIMPSKPKYDKDGNIQIDSKGKIIKKKHGVNRNRNPLVKKIKRQEEKKYGGAISSGRIGGPLPDGIIGGSPLSKESEITSGYGMRFGEEHTGLDIIPKSGSNNANIHSRFSGRIISLRNDVKNYDTGFNYTGDNSGGNEVGILTDSGLVIKNYHLKSGSIPSNIKVGTRVRAGQVIGKMGSTGRSGGSHLHYQMEVPTDNGYIPMDPLSGRIGAPGVEWNPQDLDSTLNMYNNLAILPSDVKKKKENFKAVNVEKGSNNEVMERWVRIISEIKAQIASRKRGYVLGGNVMDLSSNGFTIKIRTDCSGFVSACVSCLRGRNIQFATSNQESVMPRAGFRRYDFTGWNNLYQGDILHRDGHTEIFAYRTDKGVPFTWNCGDDKSCNNPKPTPSGGSFKNVYRLPESNGSTVGLPDTSSTISGMNNFSTNNSISQSGGGIIAAIKSFGENIFNVLTGGLLGSTDNQSSISSTYDSTGNYVGTENIPANIGSDTGKLWDYFKSLGYSDNEVSGILGAWQSESTNKPNYVEWQYGKPFKELLTHDSIATDREATNKFTKALFEQYARQGMKINHNGYKADDGNYYPGIGYAQWTGGRAKKLLDFANSRGIKWYDSSTQLAFLDNELKTGYKSVKEKISLAKSPEEAAELFTRFYEGYRGPKKNERIKNARAIYNKYSSKGRFGGPINSISAKGNNFEQTKIIQDNIKNTPFSYNTFNTLPNSVLDKNLPNIINEPMNFNSSTDISNIIKMMSIIIDNLASINNNTGASNNYLHDLNNKDFVDKGLRDTLGSVKMNRNNKPRPSSYQTATSIASLARP